MRIVVTRKIVVDNGMRLGCGVYNLSTEAAAEVLAAGAGYDEAEGPPTAINERAAKLAGARYNAEYKTAQANAYEASSREEALYAAHSKVQAKRGRFALDEAQRRTRRAELLTKGASRG